MKYFQLTDVVAQDCAMITGLGLSRMGVLGFVEAESLDAAAESLALGKPDKKGLYRPNEHSVYELREIESVGRLSRVQDFRPYEPW